MPYVSRINQLDAAELDVEIYKILRSQTRRVTQLCPQEKVERWRPELDALIKFVIWWFSLRNGKSTFGQRLLDLNYANFNRRKAVYFLLSTVLPRYVRDRFADERRVPSSSASAGIRSFIEIAANLVGLMNFANTLVFLHRGSQPVVVERFLGIASETASKHRPRQIGFSYMTRELIWHGLMEFFSVGLPMINFHRLKQTLVRFWTRNTTDEKTRNARPTMNFDTRCPYCNEFPILPRHADCEHVYCYYCINAHFAAVESFRCIACGTELRAENVKIYAPDSSNVGSSMFDDES